jgi:hypothetical protein
MYCPDCGYEVSADTVFCPQCRFQFREIAEEPAIAEETIIDLPERGVISDESILEEVPKGFSDKELRLLEVQLIQPALLLVLIISLSVYTVISTVPFIPVSLAGQSFGVTGIICLACGLVAGLIFFILARRSLGKFRYL